jgi:biotin synthase
MSFTELVAWLKEDREEKLAELWQRADEVRRKTVGDEVHLRGLIEISNFCRRACFYCGLRAENGKIDRYRMSEKEIMECAHKAVKFGFGTVVMQSGEDTGIRAKWLADIIRLIKAQTPLAVTLSLGERKDTEYALWKKAGADRYLLRFETSDPELFSHIHPSLPGEKSDRIAILRKLRKMGYEIGTGVMIGIPGQTCETLAHDICLFRELDADMIGVGPFIVHGDTPLGQGVLPMAKEQVPASELMVYKVLALTRIVCPEANIPATTALATINKDSGRELGLNRGGNVVMPNVTPLQYREKYEIYPEKACINETAEACNICLSGRIASIGRRLGSGQGGRRRAND